MKADIFTNSKDKFISIVVSRDEAIKLIKSLSAQMMNDSPNTGREEFYTIDGEYVSIVVADELAFQRD